MLKDCWLYKKMRMIAISAIAVFLVSNTAYTQPNTPMEEDSVKGLLYHARNSCLSVRTAKYYVHSYRSNPDGQPSIHSGNVLLYRDSTNNPLGWKIRFEADNGIIYCYTGEEVKVLDPKSKRFITVDASQGADKMIKGGVISGLIFNVLTDTAMWENIIHLSNDVSLEEDQKMESILCKVIKVGFPDTELFSQLTTRLFIDPNSFLVHKKINHSVYNDIELLDTLSFSTIEINNPLPADAFTVEKPDGYAAQPITRPASKEESLPIGIPAPEWQLFNEKGEEISSKRLRGKVILLDFWYSTCGPCVKSMPVIQRIHEKYKNDGVVVVGMNSKEKKAANAVNFMKKNNYTYTLALQADSVASAFGVDSYPTKYIIDAEGKIIHKEIGFGDETEEKINEIMDRILRK